MSTDALFAAYSVAMPALEKCLDSALLYTFACSRRAKESARGHENAMWEVYWAASCHFDDYAKSNWWLFRAHCESAEAALRESA